MKKCVGYLKTFLVLLALLNVMFITSSSAQESRFVVRGVIRSTEDNTPIANASVRISRSGAGVTSNQNGEFSIRVLLNDSIHISHIGYQDFHYKIVNNDFLRVSLAPRYTDAEELVVVGYSTQKKSSLVSSVSTVSGEDLRFGGRNLTNNLQGQVSGIISFQRSGEPGYDNATFWIRGISTYNGVQNPLVLVDGVPRNFNDVDPNEIATFNVLKDAAATAVFGAEGANGVILVTTKRGRIQRTQITYRGEGSFLSPFRMPEFMNATEFMQTYNEALRNDGLPEYFTSGRIDSTRRNLDQDLYPDVNWLDALLKKNTYNTRHNLSFRGGGERARFFVSGAYYSEQGLFKSNPLEKYSSNINLNRYNLRSNIDLDVTPTTLLRIDLSGQYLETNYPGVGTSTIFNTASIAPPYLYPTVYSDGKLASHPIPSGNRSNPYNLLNESGYSNEFRTNIQSRVDLEQKLDVITQGLTAKASASFDFAGMFVASSGKSINTYYALGRDPFTKQLIYNKTADGTGLVTDGGTTSNAVRNIYIETSLNYARIFNRKHDLSAMALFYQKETARQNSGISLMDRLPFRKMAYVGRATYAYDRRYSAEVNVGITGSEQFAKGYRFGVFPAVGVSWSLSNEKFYPDNLRKVVSNVKFRASTGLTGNDATGASRFIYRGGFVSGPGFNLGYLTGGATNSLGGYIEDRFAAPTLSWEYEFKSNYGVDFSLLGNKINVIFDYFNNRRENILLQRATVSGVTGFRQMPFQNFGVVTNKGYDGSINFNHTIGHHKLGARFNYTFARNKIIEKDEVPQKEWYMNETGNRMNMPYIFVAERLFTDDDFNITKDPSGNDVYVLKPEIPSQQYFNPDLKPGDIKYRDLNGDGVIDQFDKTRYVGSPLTPEITYGFGVSYGYKGFSVNVFFSGVSNTSAVLGSSNPQGFFPFMWNVDEGSVRTMVGNRWTSDNPSQDVVFPRVRPRNFANNNSGSTWWLRDASFLRLKNVEIGYTLPKVILDKMYMSAARVYIMGFNLFTWDKLKYWDPEQGANNAGMTYPLSRTITIGLEVTLK